MEKARFTKDKFTSFLKFSLFLFVFPFIINLYEYLCYSEAIRFDKLGFKIFISLLTSFVSVYVFNIYPVKSDKN